MEGGARCKQRGRVDYLYLLLLLFLPLSNLHTATYDVANCTYHPPPTVCALVQPEVSWGLFLLASPQWS